MPFYSCNLCTTITWRKEENLMGQLAHADNSCRGVLSRAIHTDQAILENINDRLKAAIEALSKNYESAKRDFEILHQIDADKRREIDHLLNKIYHVIVFATQVAVSFLPVIGPGLGSAVAAVLKGVESGEPMSVLTGAAGVALHSGITEHEEFGNQQAAALEYLDKAEFALFEARSALPMMSIVPESPRNVDDTPKTIRVSSHHISSTLDISSFVANISAFLIKIEALNESLANGSLFIPLIFAYALTPKLDVSERPYFQQAELSVDFQSVAQPGKNKTLKFTFPEASSPPAVLKIYDRSYGHCYTDEQLLKIRLYKTGFVKYTGQQTGVFIGSTHRPSMGRSVSLHDSTDSPGTALRELLDRIRYTLVPSENFANRNEVNTHARLRSLLQSLKIDHYDKTRSIKQWFFGRYNPINKLIALTRPDGIVSWYEQRRRETILAWLIIYKIFELHLGTPLPALAPVNEKTNYKMQCAFCDIIDLAGRMPYFKKSPAGGGAERNILIESLYALPGIFEYYIGNSRTTAVRSMQIHAPIPGPRARTVSRPIDIIGLARPSAKDISVSNIFSHSNFFPFVDALLCQPLGHTTNYGSWSTHETPYDQSGVKMVVDRINAIMVEYADVEAPLENNQRITDIKASSYLADISSPRTLLMQYARSNKTSDLIVLLERLIKELENTNNPLL